MQAVLFGGYFGSFVAAHAALDRPYSRTGLAGLGADIGAGVVVAIGQASCGVREAARVVAYLAAESAGQCGPCVFGLAAIAGDLDALARCSLPGGPPGCSAGLLRWAGQVEGRGACHFPDGVARFARSALHVFADEVEAHRRGHCRAPWGPAVLPLPYEPV